MRAKNDASINIEKAAVNFGTKGAIKTSRQWL